MKVYLFFFKLSRLPFNKGLDLYLVYYIFAVRFSTRYNIFAIRFSTKNRTSVKIPKNNPSCNAEL